jgi:hypothetical protein
LLANCSDRWRRDLPLLNYAAKRPYLYHLTHHANVDYLRETAKLFPAAVLMERSGRNELLRARRPGPVPVHIGDAVVWLRDQGPLYEGHARFTKGYTFEDLIESLNRRIFCWPGTAAGPISYGIRHFGAYKKEKPAFLRIDFQALLLANPAVTPRYCKYNSGSPRCSNGVKSPRGPDTFLLAADFDGTPSKVVEVTFDTEIILPPNAEVGAHPNGPWDRML